MIAVSLSICAHSAFLDYEVGKAHICYTQAQAERFVALFNGVAPTAVGVVNTEQHDLGRDDADDVLLHLDEAETHMARRATRTVQQPS
jgi:hypothetical protein